MDWNLKASSWDLTEFEQAAISAVQGSSSSGDNKSRGDFSIDLKLGRVGNFSEEMVDKWKEPRLAKMEQLPAGSSKRARATSHGTQTASCLVDGCNSDLSKCREYHRRHKVCEIHSKTPEVTIGGHKQRFCQQCSRFHSLEEFDEGKRSCRKRLDGHNRRRRKPQPEPMSRVGTLLSNYQGGQLIPFSTSQVYPSTNVMNPGWAVAVSRDEAASRQLYNQQQHFNLLDKQSSFLGSSSSSSYSKEVKQFTALQGDNLTLHNQPSRKTSLCQPLLMSIALPESGGHNMFCDRLTNAVPYEDCALSLLSSPQSQTSGISLGHLAHPNPTQLVQPSGLSLHDHGLDPMDSVLVSSGRDGDIHFPGSFHLSSDDSPGNNVSQTLPFHWE